MRRFCSCYICGRISARAVALKELAELASFSLASCTSYESKELRVLVCKHHGKQGRKPEDLAAEFKSSSSDVDTLVASFTKWPSHTDK